MDGLRSFAGSQWEPGALITAVAAGSLFWLDVGNVGLPAELRDHDTGAVRSRPGEDASAQRDKTAIAA